MTATKIQAMPAAAFTVFLHFWAQYRISVVLLCLKTVVIGFVSLSFGTTHFRHLPSRGCHSRHHVDLHWVRNNLSHPADSYYLWRWQTFLSGRPVQTVTVAYWKGRRSSEDAASDASLWPAESLPGNRGIRMSWKWWVWQETWLSVFIDELTPILWQKTKMSPLSRVWHKGYLLNLLKSAKPNQTKPNQKGWI